MAYKKGNLTQLTFTGSKSTIEALEKKCEICSKFTPFSSAVIVEFEQVHFSWEALFALIPEQIHVSHFGKFKIQVHELGFY